MPKAMRTTTHHGRGRGGKAYGSKHNDRNFDVEKADNIDSRLTAENQYWCLYEGVTFEAAELKFYEENFSEQLNATNEKYIKNRHSEHCKTMEQWKAIKQNAPEESIFQIGKHEEHVDAKTLLACYNDFIAYQRQWNEEHGSPFTVLNTALHVDEPNCPPHIHSRKVWHYQDENGMFRVGQERALELAGIELPHPERKESRYNNRKVTYDRMMREKWLDICESHGIEVERVPVPGRKGSKELEDYIREKNEKLIAENEILQAKLTEVEMLLKAHEKPLEVVRELEGATPFLGRYKASDVQNMASKALAFDELSKKHDDLQATYDDLVQRHNRFRDDAEDVVAERDAEIEKLKQSQLTPEQRIKIATAQSLEQENRKLLQKVREYEKQLGISHDRTLTR